MPCPSARSTVDTFATITSVKYYQGTNFLGQATTSPYNFTWSSVPVGYYVVTALATDARMARRQCLRRSTSRSSPAPPRITPPITPGPAPFPPIGPRPGNWLPNGVPSALDTVFISSGTVNLAAADAVSVVNLSGGTLQGSGALTVTNAFNWTGGNMADNLVVGTNATFTLFPNGGLSGLILNNYGTVIWPNGGLNGRRLAPATAITNYGLWLCQSDNQISLGGFQGRSSTKAPCAKPVLAAEQLSPRWPSPILAPWMQNLARFISTVVGR